MSFLLKKSRYKAKLSVPSTQTNVYHACNQANKAVIPELCAAAHCCAARCR